MPVTGARSPAPRAPVPRSRSDAGAEHEGGTVSPSALAAFYFFSSSREMGTGLAIAS
jgi:hypothetical protein